LFFLIALIAAFGYALQFALLASFYRKMDTLSAVAYRGLSLGLSMLPLLWWVPLEQYARFLTAWPLLLPLFLFTAAGDWAIANTVRFLPVGVATALSNGLIAIVASVIGYLFFNELLQDLQMVMMGLVIVSVLLLGFLRSQGSLPREYHIGYGLLYAALAGLFLGCGFCIMAGLSRRYHPFLVGYFWELGTGVMALVVALLRWSVKKTGLIPLSITESFHLLLASSPTLIGTGCYALSMSMGPMGLASAINSTQMVFTTLLSGLLYREKLTWLQWLSLLLICGLVMGLKLVSS